VTELTDNEQYKLVQMKTWLLKNMRRMACFAAHASKQELGELRWRSKEFCQLSGFWLSRRSCPG
jgi:hypothetical protein